MDYPCAKISGFSFSRFGFIVRTDTRTRTHTHTHTQTDADDRYTHATPVGVSNNVNYNDNL